MAVVEVYHHDLYFLEHGVSTMVARYWVALGALMGGGSILSVADWRHLRDAYNVSAVVNLEQEHTDKGYGIPYLLETPLPDDGVARPLEWFWRTEKFVRQQLKKRRVVYVHCQMGGSRTPVVLYYLLRALYGHSREEALEAINGNKEYGNHPVHQMYLASADEALSKRGGYET